MSAISLSLTIFGIMLVVMALRVPIAIAMFVAGTIGYIMQAGLDPYFSFLNSQAFARFASYDLSVIPLFILMGHFRHTRRHQPGPVPVRGSRHGRIPRRTGHGSGAGLRGVSAPSAALRWPQQPPSPVWPCPR
jgi:hypothetical protein